MDNKVFGILNCEYIRSVHIEYALWVQINMKISCLLKATQLIGHQKTKMVF